MANGPSYSVPAQIKAQSAFDNVFWWNMADDAVQEDWLKTGLFHGIKDYPNKAISSLPKPFNSPDLVVFEDFYYLDDALHALECYLRRIPYTIVPRGALTYQGQAQKRLKKIIANFLIFKPMVKHAAAIQFLTHREQADSGEKWNKNRFIAPNGAYILPDYKEKTDKPIELKGVCIGRFDPFHKGLDLLMDAVSEIQKELRAAKLSVSLYGPERMGLREAYQQEVRERGLDDILIVKDGIFGEEKADVLKCADFFLMTSRFEGMPMSMIEAMSYGLPCFATKGTNMAEEIDSHQAGWTCDNTVESIIECFCRMISQKDKLLEYGRNAHDLSLRYDWVAIAERTHKEYLKLGGKK